MQVCATILNVRLLVYWEVYGNVLQHLKEYQFDDIHFISKYLSSPNSHKKQPKIL